MSLSVIGAAVQRDSSRRSSGRQRCAARWTTAYASCRTCECRPAPLADRLVSASSSSPSCTRRIRELVRWTCLCTCALGTGTPLLHHQLLFMHSTPLSSRLAFHSAFPCAPFRLGGTFCINASLSYASCVADMFVAQCAFE